MKTLIGFFVCITFCLYFFNTLRAQDVYKGWAYFNNEQYKLAAEEFEKVIENAENENKIDRTYAQLCFHTAQCHDRLNNINLQTYC